MKQIKVLAKSIAMMDDDGFSDPVQCPVEPNSMVMQQQPDGFSWMFVFLCIAALGALIYCLARAYKMAHDAKTSFEPFYTDVAVLESLANRLTKELATARTEVQRLRAAYEEMHGEVEIVSDGIDSVHGGLVMETLRHEVNDGLRREQCADAATLQRSLMRALDVLNVQNPVPRDIKQQLFLRLGDDMFALGEKHRRNDGRIAGKYFEYAQQLRKMAFL
eukprot:s1169_g22.t1